MLYFKKLLLIDSGPVSGMIYEQIFRKVRGLIYGLNYNLIGINFEAYIFSF